MKKITKSQAGAILKAAGLDIARKVPNGRIKGMSSVYGDYEYLSPSDLIQLGYWPNLIAIRPLKNEDRIPLDEFKPEPCGIYIAKRSPLTRSLKIEVRKVNQTKRGTPVKNWWYRDEYFINGQRITERDMERAKSLWPQEVSFA